MQINRLVKHISLKHPLRLYLVSPNVKMLLSIYKQNHHLRGGFSLSINPKIVTDINENALYQATWRANFLIFIAANLRLTHLLTSERPLTSV